MESESQLAVYSSLASKVAVQSNLHFTVGNAIHKLIEFNHGKRKSLQIAGSENILNKSFLQANNFLRADNSFKGCNVFLQGFFC